MSGHLARELEDLARDVDMLVFRLERHPKNVEEAEADRRNLRRELEQVRDRLKDLAFSLT